MTRKQVNGIGLNIEDHGEGPAILLLHGFTGNADTWQPFVESLYGFRTLRVDIIGHGASDSPDDPARYSMANAVADLLALLDQLRIQRAAVVGYSMGGRLALHLATAAPERVWALILEGASPGIESAADRAARIKSDNTLADDIGRAGLESFVDRWQAQPIFGTQHNLPAEVFQRQRQQRLAGNPVGLANSLRGMGAGTQEYLMSGLERLKMPVLLIAGAADTTYSALALEMMRRLDDAVVEIIPDAGHAAHLEQPERFAREAFSFLQRAAIRAGLKENR